MFIRVLVTMSKNRLVGSVMKSKVQSDRRLLMPCLANTSTQRTYRAAVCEELGQPLVIRTKTAHPLEDTQIRIQTHYSSIMFATYLVIQGKYQESHPVPFIPGSELSGRVVEVGSKVKSLSVGDRVVAMVPSGAFAGEVVMDEDNLENPNLQGVWKLPDSISFLKAAGLLANYGTAHMALGRRAHLKSGEYVLVTGAAGGLGLAVIDVAVNVFGAKVIAACGGSEKCAIAKKCGAQYVIDYKTEDIKDRVMEITEGHGADVVFENVGGSVFKNCMKCIALEGRILVIGFASGDIPKIPANHLLLKNISAIGVYWGSFAMRDARVYEESCRTVINLCAEGKINPYTETTFPLEQINNAFELIRDRKSVGKISIQLQAPSRL